MDIRVEPGRDPGPATAGEDRRGLRRARRTLWLGFVAGNLLLCLWVFRDALWGRSMLAPLDILPAVYSKYHFMDPASSGVPANRFIVDQVTLRPADSAHDLRGVPERGDSMVGPV